MVTPPPKLLPVLHKLKSAYLLWFSYTPTIPKVHRHSLAIRIDDLLVEVIEYTSMAGFLSPIEKIPYLRLAVRKLDTSKLLLMMLWETKSLQDKKFIAISAMLNGVGADLGGWLGKMVKENSPRKPGEK